LWSPSLVTSQFARLAIEPIFLILLHSLGLPPTYTVVHVFGLSGFPRVECDYPLNTFLPDLAPLSGAALIKREVIMLSVVPEFVF
jgi:hypothetical protein